MENRMISRIMKVRYQYDPETGKGFMQLGNSQKKDGRGEEMENGMITNTVYIPYEYSPSSGNGTMQFGRSEKDGNSDKDGRGFDIWVKEEVVDGISVYRLMLSSHINQLPSKLYDDKYSTMIFSRPGPNILQYVDTELGGKKPIGVYQIPLSGCKVSFLEPCVRAVIKQILHYVVSQHKQGWCLMEFSCRDLRMIRDEVMFCGVGFLDSVSAGKRDENLLSVVRVIEELVGKPTAENIYPSSLTDLITKLENFRNPIFGYAEQESVLEYHLSILPPSKVLSFIRTAGEKAGGHKNVTLLLPPIANWADVFDKPEFELLKKWRNDFDNWSGIFDKPAFEDLKEWRDDENFYNSFDQGNTMDNLFRYCRNLAVHLGMYLREILPDWDISSLNLEIIIMQAFQTPLFAFHEKLIMACRDDNEEHLFVDYGL